MTLTGIRTNAAAELLGVTANTLRSWERRFGYPKPRRTSGGHRIYDLRDLEVMRRALLETQSISSAIEIARRRGEGPDTPATLLDAFDRYDLTAADAVMAKSLALRTVEGTVEDLLLPALDLAESREGGAAEYAVGCGWAQGWIAAVARVTPAPTREERILVCDGIPPAGHGPIYAEALALILRRAGFPTWVLSLAIAGDQAVRAVRVLRPAVVVLCGENAAPARQWHLLRVVTQMDPEPRLAAYREAGHGAQPGITPLGFDPLDGSDRLRVLLDDAPPSTNGSGPH